MRMHWSSHKMGGPADRLRSLLVYRTQNGSLVQTRLMGDVPIATQPAVAGAQKFLVQSFASVLVRDCAIGTPVLSNCALIALVGPGRCEEEAPLPLNPSLG
jgi:hypothetical protein